MGAPVNTGNQWILMPELAADDLPWLNQQMAVAGSHTRFLRELWPPRGPAGASRPTRQIDICDDLGQLVRTVDY